MLGADQLPFMRVHASLNNQALWRLHATWAVKGGFKKNERGVKPSSLPKGLKQKWHAAEDSTKIKTQGKRQTPSVRILVTASSLTGHAGKTQSIGANSIRAFLLERCLEAQAQRCRWSDDARPLHSPASYAEPVGIPPL